MTTPQVDQAADAFAAALVQWRAERGLTKKQLAAEMGFDPSYVSHVEARRHRPTEDFARRAETALQAAGMIWQRFREYEEARQAPTTVPRPRGELGAERRPGLAGLIVEHEHATLSYADNGYRCVIRRDLYNAGVDPVTRYLVRISVDRFPGEPERSNRFYRDHPLTWNELDLTAHCGDEPMAWRASHDRDAFKEVWLLFANDDSRFPLYPGQRGRIEYGYSVGEDKWGHWFQRAVKLPTRRLTVRLDFPVSRRPVVWGVETSLTAEAGPLRPPLVEGREGDRAVFAWSTEDPALNARFRLEWRFRSADSGAVVSNVDNGSAGGGDNGRKLDEATRPSELMRSAGIVQRGAPMLDRAARWFDLPEQTALAEDVTARLLDALDRLATLYDFSKGFGVSAPQLGIGWAAAVIRPPATDPIILLNPRTVGESVDRDEQYEGCLSFFDVRGLVSRPLLLEVEHSDGSGERRVTTFRRAMARLVAHEVDHLGGLLFTDRMRPDSRLVPIEEYADRGQPWRYDDQS
jgi:peptide deformylase/transcriptional regulator with XRE-family HTH domain